MSPYQLPKVLFLPSIAVLIIILSILFRSAFILFGFYLLVLSIMFKLENKYNMNEQEILGLFVFTHLYILETDP